MSEAETLRRMAEEGRPSAEEAILYAAADEIDKLKARIAELEAEVESVWEQMAGESL